MFVINQKWKFIKLLMLFSIFPLLFGNNSISIKNDEHKIVKRERAFNLLRLERALDDAEQEVGRIGERTIRDLQKPVNDDTKCQEKCNENLKTGLDMVKAHTAFGSIGVPSVTDEMDLQMFCRLDTAHDRCLRECGFEIQFNMRDYVCRDRYWEMIQNLPCYNHASHLLKRHCGGSRCGPYKELEVSLLGFGNRCRTLVCDLSCTRAILMRECGAQTGITAFRFLLDYTRVQVTSWMKETASSARKLVSQIIPRSCSRLFCDRFDATNCTFTPSS